MFKKMPMTLLNELHVFACRVLIWFDCRFQAKGMDVGVTDDSLNGIPIEQSSSEEEEESEEEEDGEDGVVKSRVKRERPVSFGKMDDVRSKWATGQAQRREEQREERKEEVQRLRSRLFMVSTLSLHCQSPIDKCSTCTLRVK
jgi:hypothetical protein